jgi:DNA mismatch repair protein MutS
LPDRAARRMAPPSEDGVGFHHSPPPPKFRNSFPFRSILFDESESNADVDGKQAPEFFTDLNLDQIVSSMTAGRDEYNLKPFFYTPLSHVRAIEYRYEILRDLENRDLLVHIQSFAQEMRTMRGHLAQRDKFYYKHQKQSAFLDAVDTYGTAIGKLTRNLALSDIRSRGFVAFREYLTAYADSENFASLLTETQKVRADLSGIRYCLHIVGKRIKVGRYDSETDYGAEVSETFEKFKQGATKEYRFEFYRGPDMNHVEAAVLDIVTQLYPEVFLYLDEYSARHLGFLESTIATFDREVQFYIACIENIEPLKQAGLFFCYPTVSNRSKEIYDRDMFDLALANKLIGEKAPVVANDFYLRDPERILVVSGPNQGGKTTFARAFGQLHYLASIGCPVPGSEAKLFLFDRLFTHFEREEDIRNQSGKLEDELLRIQQILEQATSESILVMNESFLSTTLTDALFLSKQVMRRIIQRGMLCVSVTFLDEVASLSETTVSLVSTVNPEDPALRTFKVVRKPADGLAYAAAIAAKYRLTYDNVDRRIAENAKTRIAS